MELQKFIDKHYKNGKVFSESHRGLNFTRICRGDEVVEGKVAYCSDVYHLEGTEDYFEVTESWSNSGYWSDPERYDPEFRKVKPVTEMVPVTRWLDAD